MEAFGTVLAPSGLFRFGAERGKIKTENLRFLANLEKDWFARVKDGGDPTLPPNFKKDTKTFAIFGARDRLVTKGSSELLFDRILVVDKDHLSIKKPTTRDDAVYKLIIDEIAE